MDAKTAANPLLAAWDAPFGVPPLDRVKPEHFGSHNLVWMHKLMPEAPLWGAENQSARLAELTAGTEDRAKELPLRRDVRWLDPCLSRGG